MHIFYFHSRKWFQLILTIVIFVFANVWFLNLRRRGYKRKLGTMFNIGMWVSNLEPRSSIDIIEVLPNCGIPYTCPEDAFPAHIYTGRPKESNSKLCVMGKYVTNHANNGGRGLNIAVISPERPELKDLVTFDSYKDSSITMNSWINTSIKEKDIVLIYTYDEASRMLLESSKRIFYDYGSSKVQDLHFRSQWYMVSQKGIRGFTPFEKVTMATSNNWGDIIDERFLLPVKVNPPVRAKSGKSIKAKYCYQHRELLHRYFCAGRRKFEEIFAAPLTDRRLVGNIAFSIPIAVIMSELETLDEIDSFTMTLESLIRQPGINPSNVFVFGRNSSSLVIELTKLFNFQYIELNDISSMKSIVHIDSNVTSGFVKGNDEFKQNCNKKYRIIEKVIKTLGRKERYVIVLHSGLISSPDFLYFMSQLISAADTDKSIIGISAWNPNGYKAASSDSRLIYRAVEWPSTGFLARSDICNEFCKINLNHVCWNPVSGHRIHDQTVFNEDHILYPDVSRVLWRPYSELITQTSNEYKHNIITRDRNTNTISSVVLCNTDSLVNSSYYQHLTDLIKSSITLNFSHEEINECHRGVSFPLRLIEKFEKKIFAIYYKDLNDSSEIELKSLVSCFGIYSHEEYSLGGSYYGVFRLAVGTNQLLLIKLGSHFEMFLHSSHAH